MISPMSFNDLFQQFDSTDLVLSLSQLVAGELSWSTPEFQGPLVPSFWAITTWLFNIAMENPL